MRALAKDFYYSSIPIEHNNEYLERMMRYGLQLPFSLSKACLKRKCEFLAGRYCAQRSLSLAGLKAVKSIAIGAFREPLWPLGTIGSISHCDFTAVAVCGLQSKCHGIGIDIENLISDEVAQQVCAQIVIESEKLFASSVGSFSHFLTLTFSAKESLYKALFPSAKQILGFDSVKVSGIELSQSYIILTLEQNIGNIFKKGQAFKVHFEWLTPSKIQTVCVIKNEFIVSSDGER